MTFDEFVTKYDGKPIDFDNYYGYQCVDLVRQYIKEVLNYPQPNVGNAINFYQNFTQSDYYDIVGNTPTNIPLKGDIMVWGSGVGLNGHTGILYSANMYSFVSFDQNWPVGSVCHKQNHNYNYLLGWLHPKSISTPGIDWESKYNDLLGKFNRIKEIANS